jgi:hypothetical protein
MAITRHRGWTICYRFVLSVGIGPGHNQVTSEDSEALLKSPSGLTRGSDLGPSELLFVTVANLESRTGSNGRDRSQRPRGSLQLTFH